MKTIWISVLLLAMAHALRAEQAPALRLTADTPWIVSPDEPEAMQRALADVQNDWRKVFGRRPVVLAEPPTNGTGPAVFLGTKSPWAADASARPAVAESFRLWVRGGRELLAGGADLRGSIYAAYAFSEEILGVDPWYWWADHEPAARDVVDVPPGFDRPFGPPTFRCRGWFINDEDLLCGYSPDPLRENVFSLEMWDRICETLLRLRGNMLVPGTFTFPDERAQELASRRGLILNMHHILVTGLNTFRWPKDVPFSYSKHPDIMERYWQTCIDAFKGREVVWTVGYRGRHDRPFWVDEPDLKTPAERGDVITRAIAKQVELIRKADPGAPIIANLWMEGADLMREGRLKLPEGVIQVWPDDGSGIIRDEGTVRAGQGVYYHTAMLNGRANQLSEMVNPGRIYAEVGRFARAGATNFFLVNVSDIRPVPLSTECAMRLTWNAAPHLGRSDRENMDAFLLDWCRREYGEGAAAGAAALYNRYFDIPYHRRDTRMGDQTLHVRLQQLDRAARPALAAGQSFTTGVVERARQTADWAAANRTIVASLVADVEALRPRIPADRLPFYDAHLLGQSRIHLHSLEALEQFAQAIVKRAEGDAAGAAAAADGARAAADRLAKTLRGAETGKWANWYAGECFVGLDRSGDAVRALGAILRSEPVPPPRAPRGYPELYRYQESFMKNFPLFYPTGTNR